MATIRPSSDLRNKYNEISDFCNRYNEPVFITKNGEEEIWLFSQMQNMKGFVAKQSCTSSQTKVCLQLKTRITVRQATFFLTQKGSSVLTEYKIVIEKTAENDLIAILTYIGNTLHEPNIAKRLYASIKKEILSLNIMPYRHAVANETFISALCRWRCHPSAF